MFIKPIKLILCLIEVASLSHVAGNVRFFSVIREATIMYLALYVILAVYIILTICIAYLYVRSGVTMASENRIKAVSTSNVVFYSLVSFDLTCLVLVTRIT